VHYFVQLLLRVYYNNVGFGFCYKKHVNNCILAVLHK